MPFAKLPDVSLYYEEVGTGDPLVLISGQGGDHRGWDFVRDDFAAHYRVITFDHRGTGQSDKPADPPYSTRGFANDAVALLDVLGIQRPADVNAHMANRPKDPEEAMQFLLEQMVSPEWAAAHPEYVAERRERALHPIPAFAQKLHYLASEGHDSWDLLPTITAPTLVIHGTNDWINPTANGPLLASRIPGAELHMVEGGRHGYFIEFREEASTTVLDFLARHPLSQI
jgi:pimeloyl-ACP methyl ester carboxylesterase